MWKILTNYLLYTKDGTHTNDLTLKSTFDQQFTNDDIQLKHNGCVEFDTLESLYYYLIVPSFTSLVIRLLVLVIFTYYYTNSCVTNTHFQSLQNYVCCFLYWGGGTALKITFKNLPIIKIKAVGKKVAHHGWARQENFFETKILSLSGLVCKRY